MRNGIVAASVALGALVISAGCDNSAERAQKEAQESQQRANEEAAKARALSQKAAAEQQANTNEQVRDNDRDLAQRKTSFQEDKQRELDKLNDRIDQIRVKETTAKQDVRTAVDVALNDAAKRRADVDAEMRTFGTTAAADLGKAETRIQQLIDEFEKSVSEAEKKIS